MKMQFKEANPSAIQSAETQSHATLKADLSPVRGSTDWDEYERTEFKRQYQSFQSLGPIDALRSAVESGAHWNRMYREVMEEQREEIRKANKGNDVAEGIIERAGKGRAALAEILQVPATWPEIIKAVRRMYEALKFYADPRKYEGPNQRADPDEDSSGYYRVDVTRDHGNLARTALALATKPASGE